MKLSLLLPGLFALSIFGACAEQTDLTENKWLNGGPRNLYEDSDSATYDGDATMSSLLSEPGDGNALRVLDFEDVTDWTGVGVTPALSSESVHGASALSLTGSGWMEVTSAPLSTLTDVDGTVAMSIRLPASMPNPYWYGQIMLYIDLPSQNIYNRWIGEKGLTGLPVGQYVSIELDLPPDVVAAMQNEYDDLRFRIAFNVASEGVREYLIDAIRFENLDVGPSVALGVAGYADPSQLNPGVQIAGEEATLLGEITDGGGVVSVSVSMNNGAGTPVTIGSDGTFELGLDLLYDNAKSFTSNTVTVIATDTDGNVTTREFVIETVPPRKPGELLVLFAADVTEAEIDAIVSGVSGTIAGSINSRLKLIKIPKGQETAIMEQLLAMVDVNAAFPNFPLFSAATEVNDPKFDEQWPLETIGAPDAWDYAFGSEDIIVAVIDSGIRYDYSWFYEEPPTPPGQLYVPGLPYLDNIWLNEKECCLDPPCEIACHPNLPQDDPETCPMDDLNGDGCPGICGVDDDGDGAADFNDADVKRIFSNGLDDDGDGIVDEQGPGGVLCENVTPDQMLNAGGNEDCDGASRDDDENGYPDDCRGFQFARNQGVLYDKLDVPHYPNDPSDLKGGHSGGSGLIGHGTMVACILGELGNDYREYTGVAPRVKMMPLGVAGNEIDEDTGEVSQITNPDFFDVLEAYEYAAANGALIANLSASMSPCSCDDASDPDTCSETCPFDNLSGEEAFSLMTTMMAATNSSHILNIVAAGNTVNDLSAGGFLRFPQMASLPNILLVSASNADDELWAESSWASAKTSIAAPGTDLYNDLPSGTSFAAPHVSGASVLLLEAVQELQGDPARAIKMLVDNADKQNYWNGLVTAGGILDIGAAVTAAVPEKPMYSDRSSVMLQRAGRDLPTNDVDFFDFDGDGDLDIIEMPCRGLNRPRLLRNDNSIAFVDVTEEKWPSLMVSHCDAKPADIDGDGDLDIVAASYDFENLNTTSNQNRVYINNNGTFVLDTSNRLPVDNSMTRSLSMCDVDGDGDLDMFAGDITTDASQKSNRLYMNDDGYFTEETDSRLSGIFKPETGQSQKIVCAELTKSMDAITCGLSDEECALCADPTLSVNGLFESAKVSDLTECMNVRDQLRPEIVVASVFGTITRLFKNNGDGTFVEATADLNLPNIGAGRQEGDVTSADFDSDGYLDLMFVTIRGSRNFLMLNNGDGTFHESAQPGMTADGDWAREVEAGDFDMDGDMDIIVFRGDPNPKNLDIGVPDGKYMTAGLHSYYENDGGNFVEREMGLNTTYDITADGDVGDFDNDGDLDIVIGNHGSMNQILVNNKL